MDFLWGLKTEAFFDVWTFEHLLSGVSVGAFIRSRTTGWTELSPRRRLQIDLLAVLMFAFFWETLEHYLETGLAGEAVAAWFQGVEFWANRLVSDTAALVIGYLFVRKWPRSVNTARALSACWLTVHVFVFPHSMYLHDLF